MLHPPAPGTGAGFYPAAADFAEPRVYACARPAAVWGDFPDGAYPQTPRMMRLSPLKTLQKRGDEDYRATIILFGDSALFARIY